MFSVKSMMRSAGAVGGALALLASGASAAVAAPAVFSTTGGAPWLTTTNPISLSWGGGPAQNRTCVASGGIGSSTTSNTAGQGSLNNWMFVTGVLTCTDGYGRKFYTNIVASGPALANKNAGSYSLTSPRLQFADVITLGVVLGPDTTPVSFTAPFTNGTTGIGGANPSTWTFSNTLVAYVRDYELNNGSTPLPLRMTGSFKTGTSVPLTLS